MLWDTEWISATDNSKIVIGFCLSQSLSWRQANTSLQNFTKQFSMWGEYCLHHRDAEYDHNIFFTVFVFDHSQIRVPTDQGNQGKFWRLFPVKEIRGFQQKSGKKNSNQGTFFQTIFKPFNLRKNVFLYCKTFLAGTARKLHLMRQYFHRPMSLRPHLKRKLRKNQGKILGNHGKVRENSGNLMG